MRPTVWALIHLLGGLATGSVVLLLLAAWRLSAGPLSLDVLTPAIEDAMNARQTSLRVRIDETVLLWVGQGQAFDLRLVGVRAIGEGGVVLARIPELSVRLSAPALAKGLLAPARIEIDRPSLRLRIEDDGINLALGEDAGSGYLVGALIDALSAPASPDLPISYLSRLDVKEGILLVENTQSGMRREMPLPEAAIWRDGAVLEGTAQIGLDPRDATLLQLAGEFRRKGDRPLLSLRFEGLRPADAAALLPGALALDAFDLPLGGRATVSLGMDGAIDRAVFTISGGSGALVVPAKIAEALDMPAADRRLSTDRVKIEGYYDATQRQLEIEQLELAIRDLWPSAQTTSPDEPDAPAVLRARAHYLADRKRLDITSLNADLHGPVVELAGAVDGWDGGDGAIRATVAGTLENLAIDRLGQYWPASLSPGARRWVLAHLSDGIVTKGRFDAAVEADRDADGRTTASFGATLDVEGATVDYLPPLPPVQGVSATVSLSPKEVRVSVVDGEAAGVVVEEGLIELTELGGTKETANIEIRTQGSLSDHLRLIDHPPLEFAKAIDISPQETDGQVSLRLGLEFPLLSDLKFEQIVVHADADLNDVRIAEAAVGRDLDSGRFKLQVDNEGADLSGSARLGTIEGEVTAEIDFSDNTPLRQRIAAHIPETSAVAVRELLEPSSTWPDGVLGGSVKADLLLTTYTDGREEVSAEIGLTDATLAPPYLGWSKAAGEPATLSLAGSLSNGQLVELSDLKFSARDSAISGRVRFDAEERIQHVWLDATPIGRTDAVVTMERRPDGGWRLTMQGQSFDAAPLLTLVGQDEAGGAGLLSGNTPLDVHIDVQTLWLAADRWIERAVGIVRREGDAWVSVEARGLPSGGSRASLLIGRNDQGTRSLSLQADDAGTALKTFGIVSNMRGGRLDLSGTFDDTRPSRPLQGELLITDYRVMDAPLLVHIVSALALTSILDTLRGEGLAFKVLKMPFTLNGDRLDVREARASGSALGVTASGTIDLAAETVALEGTAVPIYMLNSALGRLPVIGDLFTGGEKGGGLFAAAYTVRGPIDHPEVSVNPLSALAPSYLRELFGMF